MSNLSGPFDLIRNIYGGRDTWRLKVRVVRFWEICARDNPSNVFSIEIVLVDSEGGRIQASIRKAMIRKYMNSVAEGFVYKMTYFGVVDNGGSYRATSHDFKLLFQARTKVIPADSVIIPRFGLDLKNYEYVQNTKGECDYLIDVIGLVTVVGEEKHHERGGRTINVLELELTDDK
ncbi:Nucleic acid-binding, OB-fold [Sesbania bispinosa]|nr:Nucleic acid-binding, OB-fold [Sesbania bispinosa]